MSGPVTYSSSFFQGLLRVSAEIDALMPALTAHTFRKVAQHEIIAASVFDLCLSVKVLVGFYYECFKESTQHHRCSVVVGVMEGSIQFTTHLFDVTTRILPDRIRQIA